MKVRLKKKYNRKNIELMPELRCYVYKVFEAMLVLGFILKISLTLDRVKVKVPNTLVTDLLVKRVDLKTIGDDCINLLHRGTPALLHPSKFRL